MNAAEPTVEHTYVSTACHHNLHDRCRIVCKWCLARCECGCHQVGAA